MLTCTLDPAQGRGQELGLRSRQPAYGVIADVLRRQIADGDLAPGDQLPTERELMELHRVSASVTRSAIAQLRSEGLVDSQQGKGTFVRNPSRIVRYSSTRYSRDAGAEAPNIDEAQRVGLDDRVEASVDTGAATEDVASRLAIAAGDPVSRASYLWLVDGEPVQMSIQWEPLAVTGGTPIEVPSGSERGAPSVIARFDTINIRVSHVTEHLQSRMPYPDEMDSLRMPDGVPLIIMERTHYAKTLPVETATIKIRADKVAVENVSYVP